jgi:hypothetical protein
MRRAFCVLGDWRREKVYTNGQGMAGKPRYTAQDMINALRKTRGMVYRAADELGCSHTTVYNYMDRYPTVAREFERQRGLFLDTAESKLEDAVQEGKEWAIRFSLSMLGADRGYAPKQQIEQTGDLTIQMTWGDNDDADA